MKKGRAKTIIIIVAVILLAFVFSKRGAKENGSIMIEETDLTGVVVHSVILTNDGYEPSEVTIKKGEAIVFSTTAGNLFWPASNIHPSHSIYPEFDSQLPISPDETWAFIFDEAGSWKYHDHLNPIYRGVVNVLE